ncbi:HD domain-containing protein [Paenibacillus sp. GSMTC-2017]|uniref:YfbR-like 5'-deoxynucleotidase n=1 Tax=Paenibacillus sp. GSMTC-2017 TaxID=2794350 RepID=UPI0018D87631|nr:YfbR-like 5'-deoxynucleotidase [Paenibacillus sp. GSMTC-2017]MBH5318498.1 HD domain-containing protein [Paenibacillus sp. GSMTC-2017]
MKNSQFTNTIIAMQYVSRWKEYSPRYKDNAASHSFRCASIAILIGIIEEKVYGNVLDKLSIVARALLHDLNETVTGSIKYVTKKDAHVAEHIQKLESEVSKEIVSYLSKSLQPHFYDYIVDAEDDTYIGQLVREIDSFDAMLFCKREYELDSNPYFGSKYEQFHHQLAHSPCQSIKWILHALGNDDGVKQFLDHILNLDLIERWGGSFNLIPDNDATHSFRVAAISLFNGLLEKERFGKKNIDLYRLLGKSTMHDIVEGVSGDVASPIKKSSPIIREAFEQYEQQVAREMVLKLPDFFHEEMMDFLVHSKDATYEGQLVDIGDKIDALIKSNLEMRNNPHYGDKYYKQLVHIQHHYENPCVIFFLAYILHDLTYDHFVR